MNDTRHGIFDDAKFGDHFFDKSAHEYIYHYADHNTPDGIPVHNLIRAPELVDCGWATFRHAPYLQYIAVDGYAKPFATMRAGRLVSNADDAFFIVSKGNPTTETVKVQLPIGLTSGNRLGSIRRREQASTRFTNNVKQHFKKYDRESKDNSV